MRRTFSVLAFTALLASAAASFTVLPESTHSAPVVADATFLVPANDGYGVGDCLATGGECAQVVANAWCETQGFARATGFSPVSPEDITGSIQTVSTQSRSQPFAITCTR